MSDENRKLNEPVRLSPKAREVLRDAAIQSASEAASVAGADKILNAPEDITTTDQATEAAKHLADFNRARRREAAQRNKQWSPGQ